MTKPHFFVKLIPPRPTFPMDITAEEQQVMQGHARYTHDGFAEGKMLLYGPVMARGRAFGMAVFEAKDESEVRHFLGNDPTVHAGMNAFEVSLMRVAEARGFDTAVKV